MAVVSVGHQIVSAIETHNFAVGHDFSNHAVDNALTKGTPNMIIDYLDLLAGLALAAGMIGTVINGLRVGLLPRWMGILGMFTGAAHLPADRRRDTAGDTGLLDGHDGDPVRGQMAERGAAGVGRRRSPSVALAGAAARRCAGREGTGGRTASRRRRSRRSAHGAPATSTPAPAQPPVLSSRKRRRKRGGRRRDGRLRADGVGIRGRARERDSIGSWRGCWRSRRFEPPAEFRAHALLNDPAVYEEAASDPQGWWAAQAAELDWFRPWERVLDDDEPPFYKWFTGGTLNVSYNCLDRHVIAGRGDRVAFHWRGEEGEERDITYAELLAEVERFANALKDLGVRKGDVVGIYLPMIPEVVVSMLACARIGAPHNVVFGGFSAEAVRERMEFSRGQGADHRRRRRAQGQDGGRQGSGRRGDGRSRLARADRRGAQQGHSVRRCRRAATSSTTRSWPPPTADCPAEELDAEHPLFILYTSGSTAKPKGILHTTGGYLTGVSATHRLRLRPQARVGRLLVRRRRRLGHRSLLHRLRPARQRRHLGDVGGRSRLSRQGHLVGDRRALRRHDPLLRADRDPGLHQVGRRSGPTSTTSHRCACSARSASRSTRRHGSGTTR